MLIFFNETWFSLIFLLCLKIALKGQNFCVAAKDALSLIWCNADRFALVNGIGGAFIFIGKLFITCATTFVCYLILTYADPYKSELSSVVLPCIVNHIVFFIFCCYFFDSNYYSLETVNLCYRICDKYRLHVRIWNGHVSNPSVLSMGWKNVPEYSPPACTSSSLRILRGTREMNNLCFVNLF